MLVLAAAVGYTAFVAWQRKTGSPLMDVRLLARRPVATGAFLIAMATALMIAVFFLGNFYLQHARTYGALRTGLLFLPVADVGPGGRTGSTCVEEPVMSQEQWPEVGAPLRVVPGTASCGARTSEH
ncbi:MAG TPA: hypothetical protein VLH10_00070 [Yinghuangia sp.]|nr:hypothetical protein [Yinghuangia sp.]